MGGGIHPGCQRLLWGVTRFSVSPQGEKIMSSVKTYVVHDQPTKKDALDFTLRKAVETLADIIQTGNTWGK